MNPARSNQIPIATLAKLNIAGHSSGTNDSEKITLIVDDTRFLIDISELCGRFGIGSKVDLLFIRSTSHAVSKHSLGTNVLVRHRVAGSE